MKTLKTSGLILTAVLAMACAPAFATVQILALRPSHASPQPIGTSVAWTASATDSGAGPVTFQFNVASPRQAFAMFKDYNVGGFKSGVYTSQQFVWVPTGTDGKYQVQVVAKDFTTGESATMTVEFQVSSLVTGGKPVVVPTANPLVALFSSPSCTAGSTMRVNFQQHSKATPATQTNWANCHPPGTMTFEIAGMYPGATYDMFSQTKTGHHVTNGSVVSFKTGNLPTSIPFPTTPKQFKVLVAPGPNTDTTDTVLLHSITRLGGGVHYPDVATDLAGRVIWYYYTISGTHANLLTRPLQDGTFLSIENGTNWNPNQVAAQVLRQLDLAGNIVKETNTGIIQHQLVAMGAADGGPCAAIPTPAPLGSACLGSFHHDFVQSLPNGYSAVLADIEKIYPAGTQGDKSGLPVDIMGDMIIVLDNNWQVAWYFDTFQHAAPGGAELDINRPAVLGETCVSGQGGCPPVFLLSSGIAPQCKDWLHANTIYYWPAPQDGNTAGGDLIWSARHQDWVMKVDYKDGKGTGNILWRMGPGGDFAFNNVNGDVWPWFSHQHEVAMENGGAGPMTIFDNGNTRVSAPTKSTGPIPGLGDACGPHDCDSRGMVLNVDEANLQVTPILSQDLGYFSTAMGSAQLLSDGNYFFVPTIVVITANNIVAYDLQISPPGAGAVTGTGVYNIRTPEVYRGWQLPSLYAPPIS